MRIIENTPDRMVLGGVPGGAGAMGAFVAIGTALMVVFGAVFATSLGSGNWPRILFTPIGALIGLAMILAGADALLSSERLELDHRARAGVYTRTHRIRGARRNLRHEFGFTDIDSIVLQRREVRTGSARSSRTSVQWRAILRIDHPRRAILMHESQQGTEAPVREVAVAVAVALGRDLVEDLAEGEGEGESVAPEEFTTPIGTRESGEIGLPPQPDGARISVEIDPIAQVIRLEWSVLKSKIVLVPFIAFFVLWTAISIFFFVAALGWVGRPPPPSTQGPGQAILIAMSAAFIALGLVFLVPLVRVLLGARRTVTISPGGVEIRNPYWFRGRTVVPIAEITTVRVAGGDDDAAVIYRGTRTTRIGLHMPATGEVAWLAAALRAGIEAMGE